MLLWEGLGLGHGEEEKMPRDAQPQQTEERCVRKQIQEHSETGTVGIGS